jgi:hypothetical protein
MTICASRTVLLVIALAAMLSSRAAVAQVDTPAAREARAAIRELRRLYNSQSTWRDLAGQLSLDDIEFELRAGDRAEAVNLERAVERLRHDPRRLSVPALDQLATALEARELELAPLARARWPAECRRQAGLSAAIAPETISAAKVALARSLDAFQRRLPAIARPDDRWRAFLLWPETRWLVTSDAVDPATLDHLEARWRGAPCVWTAPELVEASLAVQSYTRLLRGYLAGESPDARAEAWNAIATLLESPEQSSALDTARLAEMVVARERLGQSCAVTSSMRRELSQANVVVRVRTNWLQGSLSGKSNERYNINDWYAGAYTTGSGTMALTSQLRVLPSSALGHWILDLEGTANASTRGSSEGVQVTSRAQTRIRGEKQFTLSARGLESLPATASATTAIVYDSINAPGRARRQSESIRQTHARRPQAESEAAASARRTTTERMNAEGRKLAEEFNRSTYARMRDRQLYNYRAGPELRVHATGDALWIECWMEDPLRFAAPAPPEPFEFEADAVLSLAASALEEHGHDVLGGRQLAGPQLSSAIGRLTGQDVQASSRALDFSVTFAERPCDFQFAADKIQARFHVTNFESADVTYPAMTVDATYALERKDGNVVLVRQGSVVVRPRVEGEGTLPLSGRKQTLRLAVQRKLNKALPNEVVWTMPELPLTGGDQPKLHVRNATADRGWLQIAFSRQ